MATKSWNVTINEEHHKVAVTWSALTNAGELVVDGEVAEAWGLTLGLRERGFAVGGKDAVLRWPGSFSGKCELYVAGEIVPEA